MSKRKPSSDRKIEILATTLDLAFEVGPDHVTTGLIAAKLGISQPAIYKHFPRKEDIWRAATETLCEEIRENIRQNTQASATPADNLRHLVLGHLHLVAQTPALPEIMVTRDPSGTLANARRAIRTEITAFRAALIETFELAQAAGHFPAGHSTDDAVTLLFGVIQSLVLRLIVTRDTTALVRDGERLLDLQLMLLANKGNAR